MRSSKLSKTIVPVPLRPSVFVPAESDFYDFAGAYWVAAQAAEDAVQGPGLSAFPACFLYRHSIELFIKAILVDFGCRIDLKKDEAIEPAHKIGPQIVRLQEIANYLRIEPGNLFERLQHFSNFDEDSYALRYHETKPRRGRPAERYLLTEESHFDPGQFFRCAEAVLSDLAGIYRALVQDCEFAPGDQPKLLSLSK